MNHWMIATPLVGLSLLALSAGCTVRERVVVARERPPARVEVIPARPSSEHVWISGRWERSGNGWYWIEGHWVRR